LLNRSDSTLRGHVMAEVAALQAVRRQVLGSGFDGVLLIPAFLVAGRLTTADIHWARIGPDLVPVGQTEFARDPAFGYTASDLKDFISQKSFAAGQPPPTGHGSPPCCGASSCPMVAGAAAAACGVIQTPWRAGMPGPVRDRCRPPRWPGPDWRAGPCRRGGVADRGRLCHRCRSPRWCPDPGYTSAGSPYTPTPDR